MAENEDPRAARSRAALIAATIDLIDERDGAVSVTDVVSAAGVSRPTLYQHFGDLPALVRAATLERVEATFARAGTELDEAVPRAEFAREMMHRVVAGLDQHATFYRRVLRGAGGIAFATDVTDYVTHRILDRSPMGTAIRDRPGPATPQDRAEFLAAGAAWHVIRWISAEDRTESADTVAEKLAVLLLEAAGTETLTATQLETAA
ncbi:TetR/AcrR family transcriptional regulator [Microbacterium indicum]|uniref:TetR/AcrR family transcriptional regulator n=1 Tax=Microbacterium indicum TaxID=358100 RepID=UPI00042957C7|nr:TetR/AcrR family transcriptional regulator [Microbacterium indicum]